MVKAGAMAVDGGMGTVLTELLGATVKGSASLIYTPPSTLDTEIEESDGIYDTFDSSVGKWELKLDSYNASATALHTVFGGTLVAAVAGVSGAKWTMPLVFAPVYLSLEVQTRSGQSIDLVKVRIVPAPNFTFTKSDAGKLAIVGTVVTPDKAATSPVSFSDPIPAA